MQDRVYPIDWKDEFAQLRPYLNGRGGVVRIRYAGEVCAPSAFLATLKCEYECKDGNRRWNSLRIDREIYSVRYISDIRNEFERKMGIRLPEAHQTAPASVSLNIMTDVEAGHDIDATVSDVTLNNYFGGTPHAVSSELRDGWINKLCEQLAGFLTQDHMMVVVNHGPAKEQDEFWRFLWRDLQVLTTKGLLLVHMLDSLDLGAGINRLAPAPELEFDLPTALSRGAQAHAIEDLTTIIQRTVPDVQEARIRADTLVRANVHDIARLHGQYAALLMQLGLRTAL